MKKLLMIGTMVAAAFVTMPASAVYYVSHWDFSSDAKGEFDITGHNDLVNDGNVPIVDGAAVFDGTAKSLVTGHDVAFKSGQPYTIECFALAEPDCDGMIMEVSPDNNAVVGGFYLYAREGVMARTWPDEGHNGEGFINGTICDGVWHHLAVIIDPTTNVVTESVRLYVDGVRQGVRSYNGAGVVLWPHRFHIGSRGGTSFPFKGKIDDVRITEGILSTNEFMKTRSAGTVDVRAYWKFDGESPLADSSGNGNTLQGSQGVTFTNGCASFNGTASDVRTAATLDLSAYTNVTVECFVRKHAGTDDVRIILEHSPHGASYPEGFYLSLNETDAGIIRGIFRFSNGVCYGDSPTYSANTGWHHLALVKDSSNVGNNSCISLYVDGVRVNNYTMFSRASDNPLRNDYLYLGSRKNSEYFLDADIDDVRITANVLAPGQFLRTRTGPLDDAIAYWPFDATNMLADASGNGNVLTGTGVTVNDGAAVLDGSQSGFATLAPLPLYPYDSMTVEWFMKSSMSGASIVLETSDNFNNNSGALVAVGDGDAGYKMLQDNYNVLSGWSAMDGRWHHYAIVYDWDATTADIVRVYRDGVEITTHSYSYACAPNLRADKLYIGARAGSSLKFVGQLDDIKITGRTLAPAEFMKKRSKPPKGMVISFM